MNDKSLLSLDAGYTGQVLDRQATLDGVGCTDTIHCSNLSEFTGRFGDVLAGSEDALDLNNKCTHVTMSANLWDLRGKVGITIKGGTKDVKVSGYVAGDGIVELGGWSDQSHERTTGVVLDLWHVGGKAVPVRVLLADEPYLVGGGAYRYLFPSPRNPLHGFFVWWFMTLRRWGLFR